MTFTKRKVRKDMKDMNDFDSMDRVIELPCFHPTNNKEHNGFFASASSFYFKELKTVDHQFDSEKSETGYIFDSVNIMYLTDYTVLSCTNEKKDSTVLGLWLKGQRGRDNAVFTRDDPIGKIKKSMAIKIVCLMKPEGVADYQIAVISMSGKGQTQKIGKMLSGLILTVCTPLGKSLPNLRLSLSRCDKPVMISSKDEKYKSKVYLVQNNAPKKLTDYLAPEKDVQQARDNWLIAKDYVASKVQSYLASVDPRGVGASNSMEVIEGEISN